MIEQVVAALIERVNQLERENVRLDKRIERLEVYLVQEADAAKEEHEADKGPDLSEEEAWAWIEDVEGREY